MLYTRQRARRSVSASAEVTVTPFITAASGNPHTKEKIKEEKMKVLDQVDWSQAQAAIGQMIDTLRGELDNLQSDTKIQNAYSPVTWVKLCREIQHVREGMTCVRLAVEGKRTEEISMLTGVHPQRIAAFRAWNTIWKRAIERNLTIKFRNEQELQADISFLRGIGIAVDDNENPKAGE